MYLSIQKTLKLWLVAWCGIKNLGEIDQVKLIFGLDILWINVKKLVLIVSLALLLQITKVTCLSLIVFSCFRYKCYGGHLKKSSSCTILSGILFVLLPDVIVKIGLLSNHLVYYPALLFLLVTVNLFGPCYTKKTFRKKEVRLENERKKIFLLSCFVFLLAIGGIDLLVKEAIFIGVLNIALLQGMTKIEKGCFK